MMSWKWLLPLILLLIGGCVTIEGKPVTEPPAGSRQETLASEAISKLENEISQLRRELEQLTQAFAQFKSQF